MPVAARAFLRCGLLGAILLMATASVLVSASPAGRPYTFVQQGQRDTFRFEFDVKASPDDVLEALYPFANLKRYSRTASAVELLDKGPGWQSVRYTYATSLWSISTTFRREVDRRNHCIRFRMTEARRTGLPVPLPAASSGEFRLEPIDGGVRVTYEQMAETPDTFLSGPLKKSSIRSMLFSQRQISTPMLSQVVVIA
jgi:hypothetical protein